MFFSKTKWSWFVVWARVSCIITENLRILAVISSHQALDVISFGGNGRFIESWLVDFHNILICEMRWNQVLSTVACSTFLVTQTHNWYTRYLIVNTANPPQRLTTIECPWVLRDSSFQWTFSSYLREKKAVVKYSGLWVVMRIWRSLFAYYRCCGRHVDVFKWLLCDKMLQEPRHFIT